MSNRDAAITLVSGRPFSRDRSIADNLDSIKVRISTLAQTMRCFDVNTVDGRDDWKANAFATLINDTLADIFGENSPEYEECSVISFDTLATGINYPINEVRRGYQKGIYGEVEKLKELLESLDRRYGVPEDAPPPVRSVDVVPEPKTREKISLVTLRTKLREKNGPQPSARFAIHNRRVLTDSKSEAGVEEGVIGTQADGFESTQDLSGVRNRDDEDTVTTYGRKEREDGRCEVREPVLLNSEHGYEPPAAEAKEDLALEFEEAMLKAQESLKAGQKGAAESAAIEVVPPEDRPSSPGSEVYDETPMDAGLVAPNAALDLDGAVAPETGAFYTLAEDARVATDHAADVELAMQACFKLAEELESQDRDIEALVDRVAEEMEGAPQEEVVEAPQELLAADTIAAPPWSGAPEDVEELYASVQTADVVGAASDESVESGIVAVSDVDLASEMILPEPIAVEARVADTTVAVKETLHQVADHVAEDEFAMQACFKVAEELESQTRNVEALVDRVAEEMEERGEPALSAAIQKGLDNVGAEQEELFTKLVVEYDVDRETEESTETRVLVLPDIDLSPNVLLLQAAAGSPLRFLDWLPLRANRDLVPLSPVAETAATQEASSVAAASSSTALMLFTPPWVTHAVVAAEERSDFPGGSRCFFGDDEVTVGEAESLSLEFIRHEEIETLHSAMQGRAEIKGFYLRLLSPTSSETTAETRCQPMPEEMSRTVSQVMPEPPPTVGNSRMWAVPAFLYGHQVLDQRKSELIREEPLVCGNHLLTDTIVERVAESQWYEALVAELPEIEQWAGEQPQRKGDAGAIAVGTVGDDLSVLHRNLTENIASADLLTLEGVEALADRFVTGLSKVLQPELLRQEPLVHEDDALSNAVVEHVPESQWYEALVAELPEIEQWAGEQPQRKGDAGAAGAIANDPLVMYLDGIERSPSADPLKVGDIEILASNFEAEIAKMLGPQAVEESEEQPPADPVLVSEERAPIDSLSVAAEPDRCTKETAAPVYEEPVEVSDEPANDVIQVATEAAPEAPELDQNPFAIKEERTRRKAVGVAELQGQIKAISERIDDLRCFDVTEISRRYDPRIRELVNSVNKTIADLFGRNSRDYWDHSLPSFEATHAALGNLSSSPAELRASYQKAIDRAVAKLVALVGSLESRLDMLQSRLEPDTDTLPSRMPEDGKGVMVAASREDAPARRESRFVFDEPIRERVPKRPSEGVVFSMWDVDQNPFTVKKAREPWKAVAPTDLQTQIRAIMDRIDDLRCFDVSTLTHRHDPRTRELLTSVNNTIADVFGRNTRDYWDLSLTSFEAAQAALGCSTSSPAELRGSYKQGIDKAVAKLSVIVESLKSKLTESEIR